MTDPYHAFLRRKAIFDPPTGLGEIPELPDCLFPHQRAIVTWALRRGRAALFAGTGLGKTVMELAWADAVHQATACNVLLLAPLAVAAQHLREAERFGIPARQCSGQREVKPGITITNYQKLQHFDVQAFDGIVLDESSILKSFDGRTRNMLIQACRHMPFRLAATATPAPNDFMELGNHAEFLGVMAHQSMLATFFVHDNGDTGKWRLKGHAESEFWRWMCQWAVMLRKPSDLGYPDGGYTLPGLDQVQHTVETGDKPARTLAERRKAARASLAQRVELAASITPTDQPFVWWCNLNDESAALAAAIPDAVEVRGSDKEDEKERKLIAFSEGRIRVLITKPSICGFGMNWQHCALTGFVGLNDSFEQLYQAIRRFWRFGQTKPVTVHLIASDAEGAVVENLARKEAAADRMAAMMVAHMAELSSSQIRASQRTRPDYAPTVPVQLPGWLKDAA